jgi:hypothetical protein
MIELENNGGNIELTDTDSVKISVIKSLINSRFDPVFVLSSNFPIDMTEKRINARNDTWVATLKVENRNKKNAVTPNMIAY